jgi:hypothetical protein
MRWEQLFADLESQFTAVGADHGLAESASRDRAEHGRLRLVDRLRAAAGHPVTLTCRGAGDVAGRLVDVGVDWLLLVDAQERDVLVSTAAVRAVGGLGTQTAAADGLGAVERQLDLRRALRGLARDRATVQCLLDDGTAVTGTVDRVGADFLELAEHAADEPRRRGSVTAVRAIVLAAVAVVRTVRPALD